ncbi:MAG TPA: prolyl oligopeptidase family serine peptidase [Gemmatimonas sp.]|nr:prolyl oligopeptidase family serine peptidase [Gemmatimonas sp.]
MRVTFTVAAFAVCTSTLAQTAIAQERTGSNAAKAEAKADPISAEGYIAPPEAIARLVTAPREANASFVSPNPGSRRYFLRTVSDGLPTLEFVGKAHHNLGGQQVDFRGNRDRGMTMRSNAGLELLDWQSGRKIPVSVPAGARVGGTSWSPDGSQLAFIALFPDATHVYLADPATGKSRAVTTRSLLATNVTNIEWSADGKSIIAVLVPASRGAEPREPTIAPTPMVRVNENNKLKTRTYADLVQTPYEKDLLAYHMTGQLAVIDVKSRAVRNVGSPGLIRSLDASPDGQHFRATYVMKPFSYYLPVSSYGTEEVIIDGTGKVLREIAKRPTREGEDPDAPPPAPGAGRGGGAAPADTGRRSLTWHPFAPGILYAQVEPAPAGTARGGNAGAGTAGGARADSASLARRKDRLVHWMPPFDSASMKTIYETDGRISAARYSENGKILFVSETGTNGTTENAIFLDENNAKFTVIAPRARGTGGRGGAGAAPGTAPALPATPPPGAGGGRGGGAGAVQSLAMRAGSRGVPVVIVSTDGKSVFQQGSTPDSGAAMPKVYVEKIDIRTGTRSRVYESAGDVMETISAPLDDDFTRLLVQRESPSVVPQSYVLDVATKQAKQLTNNIDHMPEITATIKRTYRAKRSDGKSFNVKVTLPANFKEGSKLPALFWFYPREFDNQEAYDRGTAAAANPSRRFQSYGPRTMAFLTTQGYAVVEPDAPIFASEGLLPNDNYVNDLRNDLAATIDALDTLGIIDRQRLGIGGHSYGAFSTVNAMVHTPFFKAGIAGDGAYNRTLTPNGFQSERRDLWQGRQTYLDMSPFLYADRLNGALLMYHSTEDQNVGTDPINSTKMFHALQGLGKTTSLYMYPYEDHGPIAKETVLDQWARWAAWMDKYVKNAGKDAKPLVKITSEQ